MKEGTRKLICVCVCVCVHVSLCVCMHTHACLSLSLGFKKFAQQNVFFILDSDNLLVHCEFTFPSQGTKVKD